MGTLAVQALDILATTPIFYELSRNCLEEMAAASNREVFPERCLLAQAGKSVDLIGIVISGAAELKVKDRYGEIVQFQLLGNHEFFGEMAAVDEGCSLYDIESLTPMQVLLQPRERFLASLRVHPTLGRITLQLNTQRLKRLCLALIGEPCPQLAAAFLPEPNQAMARVVQFINENYYEQLTLDQVSHVSNMSKFHFVRKFKEIIGLSFKEYLNRKRVAQAKDLMKREGLNISQACYAVGFGDLSYFGRVFRRIEGHSPSEYKKSLRIPWEMISEHPESPSP